MGGEDGASRGTERILYSLCSLESWKRQLKNVFPVDDKLGLKNPLLPNHGLFFGVLVGGGGAIR